MDGMEERTNQFLDSFWLLSQEQKRRRILAWVQKPAKGVGLLLKRIASEDAEVQIRYLARKALFHLQKMNTQDAVGLKPNVAWEKIETLLESENSEKVTRVMEWCIRHQRVELLAWIEARLSKFKDPYLVASALTALGRLGGASAFNSIRSFFQHPDARVRASCIEAMGVAGGTEATPYLLGALGSKDHRMRANAIRALRLQDRKLVLEALAQMVHSADEWMRSSAAYAIGEFKTSEVLELLASLLTDKIESIRKMAYRSLERLSDHGIVEANLLLKNLSGLKEEESIRDFLQLLENQTQQASEDLLHSEDSQVRLVEINRIVRERDSARFRDLEARLVLEEDNYIKASLILALGRVGQSSAVPLIKSFLVDPIPRIRANAIEALGSFGKPQYLPEVILRLDETNNRARANAIIALRHLKYVDVISPLKEMVLSEDPKVKQSAFFAINELGSKEAWDLLKVLAKDAGPSLKVNIRDFVLMLQEQDPKEGKRLRKELEGFIDFSQVQAEFVEVETLEEAASESLLDEAPLLKESDFEGFQPDNVTPDLLKSVELSGFLSVAAEKKAQMVEFMKNNLSQEHYTILRFAERDKDFQVKCLAKIALNQYRGKGYVEEDLQSVVSRTGGGGLAGNFLISGIGVERVRLEYQGNDSIPVLNQDLQRRLEQFSSTGSYGGTLKDVPVVLTALRRDSQDMIANALGPELNQVELVSLLYYSPTYRPFLDGQKSLDGLNLENFVQLNTMKSSVVQENSLDLVSVWLKSYASPKYLMVFLTPSNLILFLRSTLQYRTSEYARIPRSKIKSGQLRRGEHFLTLALKLHDGEELLLPRVHAKDGQDLLDRLLSHSS